MVCCMDIIKNAISVYQKLKVLVLILFELRKSTWASQCSYIRVILSQSCENYSKSGWICMASLIAIITTAIILLCHGIKIALLP